MAEFFKYTQKYIISMWKTFLKFDDVYQILIYCAIGYIAGLIVLYPFLRKYSVANIRNYKINKWLMLLPVYKTIKNEYIGLDKFTKYLFCTILFILYLPLEIIYAPIHLIIRFILFVVTFGRFRKESNDEKFKTALETIEDDSQPKIQYEKIWGFMDSDVEQVSGQKSPTTESNEVVCDIEKTTESNVELNKSEEELPTNKSTDEESEVLVVIEEESNKALLDSEKKQIKNNIVRRIDSLTQNIIMSSGLTELLSKNDLNLNRIESIFSQIKERFVQSNAVKKAMGDIKRLLEKPQFLGVDITKLLQELKSVILNEKTKIKEN